MRRRLPFLALVSLAAALAPLAGAQGAAPAAGTLDAEHPEVRWSGSTLAQTGGFSGVGCNTTVPDPTCDTFELTIGELTSAVETRDKSNGKGHAKGGSKRQQPAVKDDVRIGISTPTAGVVELDLYVYDETGAEVARSTELSSNDVVHLTDVAPGTYTVAVQNVLSSDPSARYDALAIATDASGVVVLDEETPCGLEGAPAARELDNATFGAGAIIGDPTAVFESLDRTTRISLDVLVLLDEVDADHARTIFTKAAASYEPLNIDLNPVEMRPVAFVDDAGQPLTDGLALIREAKKLLGGVRPAEVDIVEVLVGRDIQQLGQKAVAGIADCIGGVAHDDRAFLVAEAFSAQDYPLGPVTFGVDAQANITAHEIGHLMGGQHHYGNCVEGVQADDVHDDGTADGSPCTIMFNAADFLGPDFGAANGAVVRGSAVRHAQP